jgi:hypothetical protein
VSAVLQFPALKAADDITAVADEIAAGIFKLAAAYCRLRNRLYQMNKPSAQLFHLRVGIKQDFS